tara:strand:- start:1706 stop:1957 length:252 start_codon:yes stop_codon:yes gene_type:complete
MSGFNPFFEVGGLTDEDLTKKIQEVNKKLMQARRAGANPGIISRLLQCIDMCNEQLIINAARKQQEEADKKGKNDFDDSLSIG